MNILFGKRKSKQENVKPTHTLSPSIAKEISLLEEQVIYNCTIPTVSRLMELYTKSIELLEAEKNLSHIIYQQKMQSLLSNSHVINLYKSPVISTSAVKEVMENKASERENEMEFVLDSKIDSKFKKNFSGNISPKDAPAPNSPTAKPKLVINTELAVKRSCEKVIKQHSVRNSDLSKQLQDNLKKQYNGLSQRLFSRKQANTPKHNMHFRFEEPTENENEKELKTGGTRTNPVEEFENEIERILEQSIEEKNLARKEIEEKYREHLNEIEFFKGDVKVKLMQELHKNMQAEIQDLLTQIDKKRFDSISSARQRLNNKSLYLSHSPIINAKSP